MAQGMDKLLLYQTGLLVMGVATTLIPVTNTFIGLVIYAVVFGMSESCFVVMIPLITKEIVGVKRLPLALGCAFMLMGVPTVLGAPIAGNFSLSNYCLFLQYDKYLMKSNRQSELEKLITGVAGKFIDIFRYFKLLSFKKYLLISNKQLAILSELVHFHFNIQYFLMCYLSGLRY